MIATAFVTGSITAIRAAWNTLIVAEFFEGNGTTPITQVGQGIGKVIVVATLAQRPADPWSGRPLNDRPRRRVQPHRLEEGLPLRDQTVRLQQVSRGDQKGYPDENPARGGWSSTARPPSRGAGGPSSPVPSRPAAEGRVGVRIDSGSGTSPEWRGPIVDVERVNLSFRREKGDMQVLVDVSLSAYKDEYVALTGPSGCGKSTLLRIIVGLTKASTGTVKFRGQEIHEPRAELAMIFQNFVLLPWKTSLDNVVFGLSSRNDLSDEAKRKLATEALEDAGLGGFENVYPGELSGGMKQKGRDCQGPRAPASGPSHGRAVQRPRQPHGRPPAARDLLAPDEPHELDPDGDNGQPQRRRDSELTDRSSARLRQARTRRRRPQV